MVKIPILLAKASFYLRERSSVVGTFYCKASALSEGYSGAEGGTSFILDIW